MNSIAEMLSGSWFAMGFLKTAVIGLLGGAFLHCLRQRDLAAGLWAGLMLLLPVAFFSGLLPLSWEALPAAPLREPSPVVARPEMTVEPVEPVGLQVEPMEEIPDLVADATAIPQIEIAPTRNSVPHGSGLVGLWIAGGAATLIPGLLTLLAARRLRRSAAPDEISALWQILAGERAASVRVWISPDIATPGIVSLLRPQVILPPSAVGWESDHLISVLRHELHHLERHDLEFRWLGRLIRALLWFHPAAWWVQSRLVVAQERAADEAVVAGGVPAADYAGHLLETAAGSGLFPGVAMARRSEVGDRIHLLLERRDHTGFLRVAAERCTAVVMGGVTVAMTLLGFGSTSPARAEAPATVADHGFRPPIHDRHGRLIATSDPANMPAELRANPPLRWYPEGAALGHVSGFTVMRDGGLEVAKSTGLEDSAQLAEGKPVTTTIDVRIQRFAWDELAAAETPGSVVVMDPRNGEVLAMASWPSVDPNECLTVTPEQWTAWQAGEQRPLWNRALALQPPGSFAKLVLALGAARHDLMDRSYFCNGLLQVGTSRFNDHHPHHKMLDLRTALTKSVNTYFIQLALEMGIGRTPELWSDFTMPRPDRSPWSMPPARWGSMDDFEKSGGTNHDTHLAITALGHGMSRISVLDTAALMSAVASGVVRDPAFVVGGQVRTPVALEKRGVSEPELQSIRGMFRDNVSAGGTATRAKLDGIAVAGIPSTVISMHRDKLGASHSTRYVASFAGYAPAEAPRYVIAVRLEQGDRLREGPFHGGKVAAPLAARLLEALLKSED